MGDVIRLPANKPHIAQRTIDPVTGHVVLDMSTDATYQRLIDDVWARSNAMVRTQTPVDARAAFDDLAEAVAALDAHLAARYQIRWPT